MEEGASATATSASEETPSEYGEFASTETGVITYSYNVKLTHSELRDRVDIFMIQFLG